MEEKKDKTVSEKLDEVMKALELTKEGKKEKKFKLPFGIRSSKGKFKKDYIIVLFLKTNGSCDFKMYQIEDNTIKIGEVYYEATSKHIMRYKRFPLMILPEWNISPITKEIEPFNPEKNLEEAVDAGKLSSAEKFILHAIKMDLVKTKMKINLTVILIALGAIVGILVLLSYLKII
jgi:hypothetical protein